MIDEVLGGAARCLSDCVGRLALGTHEQHTAAARNRIGNLDKGLVKQRSRLR